MVVVRLLVSFSEVLSSLNQSDQRPHGPRLKPANKGARLVAHSRFSLVTVQCLTIDGSGVPRPFVGRFQAPVLAAADRFD